MATTDTQLQQLVINVGTDAQIQAGIASGTITEDMLSIATDGADITYDWVGTLAEYNAENIATVHPDWLCFITDDVNANGENVYENVYSKTEANETFVAKVDNVPKYLPNLLEFKWSDHILNNTSWLRADTFSWQSGELYEAAYEHLAADIEGKTLQTETISGITISYYLADDGHKICPANQEENIRSLYNATGITWYFIIDTTNTKFKLPRTKWGFVGLRNGVGKYIAPGLPNITGSWTSQYNISMDNNSNCKGAIASTYSTGTGYYGSSSASADWGYGFNFDASKSNFIYGASSTVQSPATEMYLYFYVGEFSQDAIENTAGLNSELFNDKADLVYVDAQLATKVAKGHEVIAFQNPTSSNSYMWYRKYADGWVEQGQSNVTINEQSTVTKTLPIKMANTYYTALAQNNTASTAADAENGVGIERTSTTQIRLFTHYINPNTINVSWMICGMAA